MNPAITTRPAANDRSMTAPVAKFRVTINYPGRAETWIGIYPSQRAAENDGHALVESVPFAIRARRVQ